MGVILRDEDNSAKRKNYPHANISTITVLEDMFKDLSRAFKQTLLIQVIQMKIIHKYNSFPNFEFVYFPYK